MPKGTPLWPKCPRCKRGQYGEPRAFAGTLKTGRIETAIYKSAHKGHGSGGRAFIGHRGEMRCGDCGHTWFSTHDASGRIRCNGGKSCTHAGDNHAE